MKKTPVLPIDEKIPLILNALKGCNNLVLSAQPGAGKTTRLPPALLQSTDKQVWVLEPRRVAAIAAATRIAQEENWTLGQEVGYQVRFEGKWSQKTRLHFLTEALLARKILNDPDLRDVGIIVIDEFHERSIHVDVALGLLKEIQMLSRPDLKIIVMSATLDSLALTEFLTIEASQSTPLINIPGLLYPLEILKSKQSQLIKTDQIFIERVRDTIRSHCARNPKGGDILIFLPGLSELRRVERSLLEWGSQNDILIYCLSGSLSIEEQMKVLRPASKRKIILSTNVAESSVTIDGVDAVIDSGLARTMRRHPKTDFEQLVTSRISKASAKQRAGRAARQVPGSCLQLWTTTDELSMPDFEVAEVHRLDLTETVLFLKRWGAKDLLSFSWFEKPPKDSLIKSEAWLEKVQALKNGIITNLGVEISEMPIHPRLALIIKSAEKLGAGSLGCDIAAILQERDFSSETSYSQESDLLDKLDLIESERHRHQRRNPIIQNILRVTDQLQKYLTPQLPGPLAFQEALLSVPEIMLMAYPDRLCRRRGAGRRQALMVGGRGVELSPDSSVKESEFFIALDLLETDLGKDTQIRKATSVTKPLIEKYFSGNFVKNQHLIFDEDHKNFYIEEFSTLWNLPIEEPRRRIAKHEEISEQLPNLLFERWQRLLFENEALNSWWQRWTYFESKLDSTFWSDEKIHEALTMACVGENRWSAIVEKDLTYFFESLVDSNLLIQFNRDCPPHIEVPTGNKIKLHYHTDKNPHLEVRLQELFGMSRTPMIMNGAVAVTLHLLGPNYRPVQMTSDLSSFWKNTYSEVKREMKTRYPKHSWPDDPLTAPAVARGRPKK